MSRISADEAARLWHEASDDELRGLATAARARWHEPDRATYMVMRIVNYTNVCVAQCDYCAFYVLPNEDGGYVLDRAEVFAKIDELLEVGGDLVAFNGGFNPRLPLDYYCDLFASVRERYGERVEFYALTVAEFVFLADRAGLTHAEAAARLRDAGVYWVTGGGSEILTEDFRKRHAKFKYTVAEYLDAQRAIVESGMRTTATMVIGFDETLDERLEHLQRTRDFQDALISGPPPLGPGAPAAERLRAFGDGYLDLLERHAELLVAAAPPGRDGEGPLQLYATHLAILLGEAAPQLDAPYTARALLATLNPAQHVYSRRVLGWPLERLRNGWRGLVDALSGA